MECDSACQPPEEDDVVHHVEVKDIRSVAYDLGIPVRVIVSSMIDEAHRQEQEQQHPTKRESGVLAAEASPLMSTAFGSPGGLKSNTLRSVRVSLANVAAVLSGDAEDDVDDHVSDAINSEKVLRESSTPLPGQSSSSDGHGASNQSNISFNECESIAVSNAGGIQSKRAVRFAASEIERVHVYEVDNSLFITIEYARPLFGWILLFTAIIAGACSDVFSIHSISTGTSHLFTNMAWVTAGELVGIVGVLLPLWFFTVKPTKVERMFLTSAEGLRVVFATGLMGSLVIIAFTTNAFVTGQWRAMALSAAHAPLIVLFGKVFRNTVFLEEAIGSGVFVLCFVIATLPADVNAAHWEFAEVLALAMGIYMASFLFLAVKARSRRVSVPVVASAVVVVQFVLAMIICAIVGAPFLPQHSHADGSDGGIPFHGHSDVGRWMESSSSGESSSGSLQVPVFGFFQSANSAARWIASSFAAGISLVCYLMALRFIPPLTVSVALCVQQLLSQFSAYLLLFNAATAPWPVCPAPLISVGPFTTTAAPALLSEEQQLFCGGAGSASSLRNALFSVGSCIAVVSGGYLVYVSSIKRSKVDRLLKHLSNRKIPKNPYRGRGGAPSQRLALPQPSYSSRNRQGSVTTAQNIVHILPLGARVLLSNNSAHMSRSDRGVSVEAVTNRLRASSDVQSLDTIESGSHSRPVVVGDESHSEVDKRRVVASHSTGSNSAVTLDDYYDEVH